MDVFAPGGMKALPAGLSFEYDGHTAPAGSLFKYGQAVSRTTYAALLTALRIQQSGTRTNASAVITALTSTEQMAAGQAVEGTGIPAATTILSVDSATQITLSANATSSGTSTVSVFPHGAGNGTTTFNVPDDRGRVTVGRDNMGGAAASRVTNAVSGIVATGLGKTGGNQLSHQHSHGVGTIAAGAHSHGAGTLATASDGAHTHDVAGSASWTSDGAAGITWVSPGPSTTSSNGAHTHTISGSTANGTPAMSGSTANSASAGASENMPPAIVKNKIITTGGV